ncbi:hypothetical protein L228DRAFT_264293 [Xylona heveae TC161]|uniref:Uncharacterized protein n=1 Tax=Xylona heveae (strain CBS 132557 / TC161) TaxID=1328760 RepID=A0A164Z7M2_XYLHT|nr:hypothetical protein L228DRAFT_264293 [Xylona heveae TC161]KZF18787.1 hypothetical protein L228DRAFT_264293 [Xylona heveae TC161]
MDRIKGTCHQKGIYRLSVNECDPDATPQKNDYETTGMERVPKAAWDVLQALKKKHSMQGSRTSFVNHLQEPNDGNSLISPCPNQRPCNAFRGTGGMSQGAKMAGLVVDWGFDFDYSACGTYRRNPYRARI